MPLTKFDLNTHLLQHCLRLKSHLNPSIALFCPSSNLQSFRHFPLSLLPSFLPLLSLISFFPATFKFPFFFLLHNRLFQLWFFSDLWLLTSFRWFLLYHCFPSWVFVQESGLWVKIGSFFISFSESVQVIFLLPVSGFWSF